MKYSEKYNFVHPVDLILAQVWITTIAMRQGSDVMLQENEPDKSNLRHCSYPCVYGKQ